MVLGTNVLLSGLAYPASVPGELIAARRHGALNLILSPDLLEEVRRTLPKLMHRHELTPRDLLKPSRPCRGDHCPTTQGWAAISRLKPSRRAPHSCCHKLHIDG
ncbi:MAG: PIN domain-containing protein [Cyanobacteriota bacterium]|nr:PIN domain-containing protein [Cyanobacteriota bacterium]